MKRAIQRILTLARDHRAEPGVHFHQGPQGTPAVCYETGCPIPRLTVE